MKAGLGKHLQSLGLHFLHFAARDPLEWAGGFELMRGKRVVRGLLPERTPALHIFAFGRIVLELLERAPGNSLGKASPAALHGVVHMFTRCGSAPRLAGPSPTPPSN